MEKKTMMMAASTDALMRAGARRKTKRKKRILHRTNGARHLATTRGKLPAGASRPRNRAAGVVRAVYGGGGISEPLYGASVAATLLLVLRNVRVPAEKVAPSVSEILQLQRKHRGQGLRAFVETERTAGHGEGGPNSGDGRPRERFQIRGAQGWKETLLATRCARQVASTDAFIVSSSSSVSSVSALSLLSRVPTIVMDKFRYEPSTVEPALGPDESCLPDVPSVSYGQIINESRTPVLSLEWRRAIAKLCDGAVPGFGLTLLARPEGSETGTKQGMSQGEDDNLRLGVATLRVKRLPPNELRVESTLRRFVATHFRAKFHEYFGEYLTTASTSSGVAADAENDSIVQSLSLDHEDDYYVGQTLWPELLKDIKIPPNSFFRNVGYITWLGVTPNCRGAGVGRRLLEWMEKKVAAWGLDILALHCHRRNGTQCALERDAVSSCIGRTLCVYVCVRPQTENRTNNGAA